MIYYINKFNVPNTDDWRFAVWQVERNRKNTRWYTWIKKIYDPENRFDKWYVLDPTAATIAESEHKLIEMIFLIANLRGIKAKR